MIANLLTFKSFYLMVEGMAKNLKNGIEVYEPPLVPNSNGEYPQLPNALQHNGKQMFYSFDLTNICNRGCPGCYVARSVETRCNSPKLLPIKEYKGDLSYWEEEANRDKSGKKRALLDDAKAQINANGGIRMFSMADYPSAESEFYSPIMAKNKVFNQNYFKEQTTHFLNDAAQTGWKVKAITKEEDFLKHHAGHEGLGAVNLSMNAQGFGFSADQVKQLKSVYGDKVSGRIVVHTPHDLFQMLQDDISHIGVVTSAHDIPGIGIRYTSSEPKDLDSPKIIVIQKNFPEKLMSILDGSLGPELLFAPKVPKPPVEQLPKKEKPFVPITVVSVYIVRNENGEWVEYEYEDGKLRETRENGVIPDIENDFAQRNPKFEHRFNNDEALQLISNMSGKMCCAGEREDAPAYGKCHNCKSKCGTAQDHQEKVVYDDKFLNATTNMLNKYVDDYNKTVDRVTQELQNGKVLVNKVNIKGDDTNITDIRKDF